MKHCFAQGEKNAGCESCPKQVECQERNLRAEKEKKTLRERLAVVPRKIAILSGKGGVGKSTVARALALFLAQKETNKILLLDLDVTTPSAHTLLGCSEPLSIDSDGFFEGPAVRRNLHVVSSGLLFAEQKALAWTGAERETAARQLLGKCVLSGITHLVIDTSPGTAEEHLVLGESSDSLEGLLVTTPSVLSLEDVRKQISFCRKLGIKILGLLENMSGFVCPGCTKITQFSCQRLGEELAKEEKIPFLGRVPLQQDIAKACEENVYSAVFEDLLKKIPL